LFEIFDCNNALNISVVRKNNNNNYYNTTKNNMGNTNSKRQGGFLQALCSCLAPYKRFFSSSKHPKKNDDYRRNGPEHNESFSLLLNDEDIPPGNY
jgi:hypothetical protein